MTPDKHIFAIRNIEDDQIISIMCSSIANNVCTLVFSFTLPIHRRMGYATKLRTHIIDYCKHIRCNKIQSVPFFGALSVSGLVKQGFRQKESDSESKSNSRIYYELEL